MYAEVAGDVVIYLNMVRIRVGMPLFERMDDYPSNLYPTLDFLGSNMKRRIELCFETPQDVHQFVRTGRAAAVLDRSETIPGFRSDRSLFPSILNTLLMLSLILHKTTDTNFL